MENYVFGSYKKTTHINLVMDRLVVDFAVNGKYIDEAELDYLTFLSYVIHARNNNGARLFVDDFYTSKTGPIIPNAKVFHKECTVTGEPLSEDWIEMPEKCLESIKLAEKIYSINKIDVDKIHNKFTFSYLEKGKYWFEEISSSTKCKLELNQPIPNYVIKKFYSNDDNFNKLIFSKKRTPKSISQTIKNNTKQTAKPKRKVKSISQIINEIKENDGKISER